MSLDLLEATTMDTPEAMAYCGIRNTLQWSRYVRVHGLRKRHTAWGSRWLVDDLDAAKEGR